MSSRPLLLRLVAPFAILMALIVATCGAVVHWAGERNARRQQIEDLNRLTPLVRQWASESPALEEAGRRRLVDSARLLNTRITLIDARGAVLVESDASAPAMENHNGRPEVVAARREGLGSAVRHSNTLGEDAVYVAAPLDPHDPAGVILRLSFPRHGWATLGTNAWAVVGWSVLAALLALGWLTLMLHRRWIGPTYRLAEAAERMAAGEWDRRVKPAGARELRYFSTRLNLLASHAQRQLAELQHQRADLQALVDTLPDPVLLTDASGKLSVLNTPAAKLLDLPRTQALGRPVVNVLNDEAVLQVFERVRQPSSPAGTPDAGAPQPTPMREIRLNRGGNWLTYQAVATRTADGGVLLVLRDISALALLVQMKTDFVANASHELRTPIAAIKIAFETLEEVYAEDPRQTERCVRIIGGHLNRLEDMLRDLLDLSRVENGSLEPHVKRICTNDLFAHLRSSLGPMAQTKLVELRFGLQNGSADGAVQPNRFFGDERLLNLVLKNLVENSIKFTPPGGSVTVAVRERANDGDGDSDRSAPLSVTVTDTGIGIPQEHADRVFERFYQVDAARSGSAGRGTGLGLAIVKHAVAAMGGTVHLESAVGKGTTVTCELPQHEAGETN